MLLVMLSTWPELCHLIVDPVNLLYSFVTYVVPQGIWTEPEVEQAGQKNQGACALPEFQAVEPALLEPCLAVLLPWRTFARGWVL